MLINPFLQIPETVYVEDRQEVTQGVPHCFVVGLDLGKSQDYTALTVSELHKAERIHWKRTAFAPVATAYRRREVIRHQVVNLHRYPRGTDYPSIYRSVQSVMRQLPPRERKPELVVDKTGVGAPVVDAMREMGMAPIAVSITGGRVANMNDYANYTVPKALLASVLDITLSEERLEITEAAGASEALRMELQNFHAKVSANGSVALEAWREGHHDDLVLSMALAVWRGENLPQPARWTYIDIMSR
ncbi:hypothetical protein [Lichenicoccus sp.]|uniref:hypothetical protein n=1 Tax=Lichenicoccus sp. TaxID=2781899 RepID=UPI003D141AB7